MRRKCADAAIREREVNCELTVLRNHDEFVVTRPTGRECTQSHEQKGTGPLTRLHGVIQLPFLSAPAGGKELEMRERCISNQFLHKV
jgi:hypothetical protein